MLKEVELSLVDDEEEEDPQQSLQEAGKYFKENKLY
jgi:hypothetical protein